MPITYYLGLSVIMFVMGFIGVVLRRNALVIFMSLELMFNAANLVFVSHSSYFGKLEGEILVFFVMTVAASEVAIGLALMVEIFKTKKDINIDQMNKLKG